MNPPDSIEHLDRSQCFLLFATFCGDAVATAAALGISPVAVLRIAEEEKWLVKLEPLISLAKSQRPGALEKAINRATNFVMCHRMRLLLERTIRRLTGLSTEEFTDLIEEKHHNKDGDVTVKLSTRALCDLASAIEKCQSMTYAALGDTQAERAKQKVDEDGDSCTDIHAKLAAACAAAGMSQTPRALLFDAQVTQAETLADETSKKAAKAERAAINPYNADN